jgi:hypothetical protein
MITNGFCERINVMKEDGGFLACLRLLKPYTASNASEQALDSADATRPVGPGISLDLPLDIQMFIMIAARGDNGLTSSALQECLNDLPKKVRLVRRS